MGKSHQNCQLPFILYLSQTIYFYQNVVEVVTTWRGKSMGKFELGRAPSFECRVLTSWEIKKPRTVCQFGLRSSCLRLDSHFGSSGASCSSIIILSICVEALRKLSSSCVYPSCSASVFPWRDCDCCVAMLS